MEARVFVSLAGTLLEAEITAVDGENVTLKRVSDGQPLTVARNTLCKEDHAYIARWVETAAPAATPPPKQPAAAATVPVTPAAAGPLQKYSLTVQAMPSKNNQAAAGSAVRVFEVTYTFNVSNREVSRDLEGAKAVVVTLGKNATNAGGDLVVLQKLKFDLAVRAQSKTSFTTPPMQLTYSAEYRYGVRSHGYVLFLLDSAGNVLLADSSPEGSAKYFKEISALAEIPCMVDRDFKPQPGLENISSYISL
ncbi:MAG: hypothetical protein ACO1TE_15660 [Prosthecobacter sp.]